MGKLTPELRKVLKLQYPDEIAVEVKGEIVHFKDTEENWEKLGNFLGLELFKENECNRNWVLYNPKNFKSKEWYGGSFYLMCISEENLEAPINCSSYYNMFCDFEFKSVDALKNFDTSGVKDMTGMFSGSTFPDGFSFGDKFNISEVESMRCMFSYCKFSNRFSFGNDFDTNKVEDMTSMFSYCELHDGFSLGDKFDISNTKYSEYMFLRCKLPEGKTEKDFDSDYNQLVKWLKSRNCKYSVEISNINFFNK